MASRCRHGEAAVRLVREFLCSLFFLAQAVTALNARGGVENENDRMGIG